MEIMDIWNWLWVLAFPALLVGAYITITSAGKRALSRHLSEKDGQDFSEWWLLATETRKRKAKELADWDKDFQAVLRRTCTHRFEPNRWDEWWKCVDCAYEPKWEHSGDCSCKVTVEQALTDPKYTQTLVQRNRFCPRHGRELYVQRALKEQKKYSGGGYLGLHADNLSAAERLLNVIDGDDRRRQ